MSIQFIKYVCLNCNKCLSDLSINWCSDCFANAKAHHSVEEKIGKLEAVVEAAKNLVPRQNPKLGQEICQGYDKLYLALKALEQE